MSNLPTKLLRLLRLGAWLVLAGLIAALGFRSARSEALATMAGPAQFSPPPPAISCIHVQPDGAPVQSVIGGPVKLRCFAFEGKNGDTAVLTLEAPSENTAPSLQLFDPDGALIASSEGGQALGEQLLLADGRYSLLVQSQDAPTTTRIRFTAQVDPLSPDDGAAGDTLCTGVLTMGYSVNDMIDYPGATCRFVFAGRAGQVIDAAMHSRDDLLQPQVSILDPSGQELAVDNTPTSSHSLASSVTLPVNGVYTVVAGSQADGSAGFFDLAVRRHVVCGQTIGADEQVVVRPGAGECHLAVEIAQPGPHIVLVEPDEAAAQASISVTGPTGKSIPATRQGSSLFWSATRSGLHTLLVTVPDGGTHNLAIRVVLHSPPPPPPPHPPTCGEKLGYGAGLNISKPGQRIPAGSRCEYDFRGKKGDIVSIAVSLSEQGNTLSPEIDLIPPKPPGSTTSPRPEATAGDLNADGTAEITRHVLAKSGTYTIQVEDYNGKSGDIQVRLQRVNH